MAILVIGIVINIVMVLIILVTIIFGVIYNNDLTRCETEQSSFCHVIQCPCDINNNTSPPTTVGPCFGYAKAPAAKPGQWYCSNAPITIVDNDGNIV